jgi:hypothetical protein
MVSTTGTAPQQLPLLHIVESDDIYLAEHAEVTWFHVLRELDWRGWVDVAAQYYETLYRLNAEQARQRGERAPDVAQSPETQGQARLRLALARPTERGAGPLLAPEPPAPGGTPNVVACGLRPGVVPLRAAGRPPKCFFALTKAFLGVLLRGRAATPEHVHEELTANPAFARACGFTLPRPHPGRLEVGSVSSDVPSLRKLEQFDQLMTAGGLWDRLALDAVKQNLASGRLKSGGTLVHDTTHYEAYSTRTAVEVGKSNSGKPRRKSHPRTTKNCRCADRENCGHAWVSADPGAGTVTKSGGKQHWAHKASTMSFTGQEVPLDAVAMIDAASHDSRSVEPHLERIFRRLPQLRGTIGVLLDDAAADDAGLKARVRKVFEIEVVASQNTRSRRSITKDLPRGIEKITPTGMPVCRAGLPLDLAGCCHTTGHFVFRAPDLEEGRSACGGCALREGCIRPGAERRHVRIAFDRLPWLDPALPQLSKTFARMAAARTVIERIHNLMKYEYGSPRLHQRGTASVQATLDKTLWAMHVVLARG